MSQLRKLHSVREAAKQQVLQEYRRRETAVAPELYAPWNSAEALLRDGRRRLAVKMLRQTSVFPKPGDQCLEVGYGHLGWLAELVGNAAYCRPGRSTMPVVGNHVGNTAVVRNTADGPVGKGAQNRRVLNETHRFPRYTDARSPSRVERRTCTIHRH